MKKVGLAVTIALGMVKKVTTKIPVRISLGNLTVHKKWLRNVQIRFNCNQGKAWNFGSA